MKRSDEAPITPLELPRHIQRLLVFGGSFDPPHSYHLSGPFAAWRMFCDEFAEVLYVPAAKSPFKPDGTRASDEHRLAMLRLALDGSHPIWTDEIDRAAWERARGVERPSYTVDTLRRLREVVPDVELRLLIGSDQLAGLRRWKDVRQVVRLAEPLVLVRPPVTTVHGVWNALDQNFWTMPELREWCGRIAPNVPVEESSTRARDAIPGAPDQAHLWEGVEPLRGISRRVAEYIIANNLYGFRTEGKKAVRPGDHRPARAVTLKGRKGPK
ncbi:MAG TPA: nicotinate-nicotinamide nucleotide adenylyltransferase [Phycisphaerales bacterium]|nr:nicotinate-nicotinamide nucleotide adenylyltransferase [Phycisphaerales bacterium]